MKPERAPDLKIFIQDKSTHLYLNGKGEWTAEKENARDFMSYLIAIRFLTGFPQRPLQVVASRGLA